MCHPGFSVLEWEVKIGEREEEKGRRNRMKVVQQ